MKDFYNLPEQLILLLRQQQLEAWAVKFEEAMAGSTGTEIMMALKFLTNKMMLEVRDLDPLTLQLAKEIHATSVLCLSAPGEQDRKTLRLSALLPILFLVSSHVAWLILTRLTTGPDRFWSGPDDSYLLQFRPSTSMMWYWSHSLPICFVVYTVTAVQLTIPRI